MNRYDGNWKDLDPLPEGYGRADGHKRGDLSDRGGGQPEDGVAGLLGGQQGRNAGGTVGRGAADQRKVERTQNLNRRGPCPKRTRMPRQ